MTRLRVSVAGADDMVAVRRLRHDAYARELGQHAVRPGGELPDPLDGCSAHLVVLDDEETGTGAGTEVGGGLVGYVAVTPPSAGRYSLDKDVSRADLPFAVDGGTHEVRLLTVAPGHRGSRVAPLLMLAALRWVEAAGGDRLLVKGRRELVGMYERVGLVSTGRTVRSGAVDYEVMSAAVADVRSRVDALAAAGGLVARVAGAGADVRWEDVPSRSGPPAGCFHGGASWEAVGDGFAELGRRRDVVPADVLDAWFPPAPGVLEAVAEDPAWLLRTSPPTDGAGLLRAVSVARGVGVEHLLPGAGSSALVFLALGRWLDRGSRVLLVDPTYGEYAHVLERVVGARVDRLPLHRGLGWVLDPQRLVDAVGAGRHDLVVVVNPNSPTGRHVPRASLQDALAALPAGVRVWVDETYVDYVGPGESLEAFAAASHRVVVVKSMSKAYALSGARVAYLCGPADVVAELRAWTPPWAVSLQAQLAGVRALEDPEHYARCWRETARLRAELAAGLGEHCEEVVPGTANFLLGHLPAAGPTAADVVAGCRRHGVFVRDAGSAGTALGDRSVRVAVRSGEENARVLAALGAVLARG